MVVQLLHLVNKGVFWPVFLSAPAVQPFVPLCCPSLTLRPCAQCCTTLHRLTGPLQMKQYLQITVNSVMKGVTCPRSDTAAFYRLNNKYKKKKKATNFTSLFCHISVKPGLTAGHNEYLNSWVTSFSFIIGYNYKEGLFFTSLLFKWL